MSEIRWLLASDLHFPRHDPRMVSLWLDVLKWFKPNAVDLLGDIDDADSTSRWAEGTSRSKIALHDDGVIETRNFLADIRGLAPKADCHFHDGNHGWFRHEKYFDKNAPQALEFITADTLYEYKKVGFDWHTYGEPPVKRFGNVWAHHGESISKHAGESVRNDVMSWGISLVRGHSHRQGSYAIDYHLTGNKMRGWEIGHMTNISKMTYDRSPNWQAGFAYALVDGDNVHMQLVEIHHDYTAYVAGKLFRG